MSKSDSESLSQDMKQGSEQKAEEAYRTKKISKNKEEEGKYLETKEHQHPVSESSRSITFQSPATPPYTRTHMRSSPTLHSLHDSPITGDNFHSSAHKPPGHFHSSVSDGVPPVVVANQFQVEPNTVAVVGPDEVEEGTGGRSGRFNHLKDNKKEAQLTMTLLGLRVTAFVFCMISFSVLAADKQGMQEMEEGWAQESFYQYKEFKYSLSVNVIGFAYSGLQICDLVKYLITEKHIVDPHLRGYFNFAMDQILTYLLMSSSTSAVTLTSNWESNSGADKFTEMANASVALSYVAFVAFALTSLVSGYILCRLKLV